VDAIHRRIPGMPMWGTEVAGTVSTRGIYANRRARGAAGERPSTDPGRGSAGGAAREARLCPAAAGAVRAVRPPRGRTAVPYEPHALDVPPRRDDRRGHPAGTWPAPLTVGRTRPY